MSYVRFAAMIATSTFAMFALTYLNTYSVEHVKFSETRVYMALLMGSAMALIMLMFMRSMYKNRRINVFIVLGCLSTFTTSLWLVRSQQTVDDVHYMKAMIPHHSTAIMTSERAQIRNPRVRRLADRILNTQVREIGEMEALIAELEANPPPRSAPVLRPLFANRSQAIAAPAPGRVQQASDWAPTGYWAETSDLCQERRWLLARTRPASPDARTCVVRHERSTPASWSADCPELGQKHVTRLERGNIDRIRLGLKADGRAVELVRCDSGDASGDKTLFNALRAEADAIDELVLAGRLVGDGVVHADEIFLVRAWRQDGEILKIVAPLGGGPAAGRDREFYFRPGETTPFMIRDPFATFVLADGRIVAWLDSYGELISAFVPHEPDRRELGLIAEASALRKFVAPSASDAGASIGV